MTKSHRCFCCTAVFEYRLCLNSSVDFSLTSQHVLGTYFFQQKSYPWPTKHIFFPEKQFIHNAISPPKQFRNYGSVARGFLSLQLTTLSWEKWSGYETWKDAGERQAREYDGVMLIVRPVSAAPAVLTAFWPLWFWFHTLLSLVFAALWPVVPNVKLSCRKVYFHLFCNILDFILSQSFTGLTPVVVPFSN